MFDNGFFGELFDFDGNGELDTLEQACDFAAFMQMIESCEEDEDRDPFDDDTDPDLDF